MKVRLKGLDVLRGFAALAVFTFHFVGLSWPHTQPGEMSALVQSVAAFCGSLGTNMLLLLSGFFVGQAESSHVEAYRHLLARRMLRIYPTYAVALVAALVWSLLIPAQSKLGQSQSALQVFFEQLILFPGLFPDRPFLTVSWTLSFIVAGYVILPLIARTFRFVFKESISLVWLWLLILFSVVLWEYHWASGYLRLAYIPAGCLIAEATLKNGLGFRDSKAIWLGLVGTMFFLAGRFEIQLTQTPSRYLSMLFVMSGIGAVSGLTLSILSAEDILRRDFSSMFSRLLIWIGKRGYSFYLFHGPVIKAFILVAVYFFSAGPWPTVFPAFFYIICGFGAIAVSNISYQLLERHLSAALMRRMNFWQANRVSA